MKICSVCNRSWEDDFRMCPIDGSPLQSAGPGQSDPNIGRNIGKCRVVEKIGDGDLGAIYKSEEPIRGIVALQIINPDRISSPILLEAFSDAVKLAVKLSHPHVVRVYGLETAEDGTVAVLMEYAPGTTLEGHRKRHPGLDIAEACRITREAAEGLMAAHRLSMLHGALHPTRIFLANDGSVKVSGFHRSGLREGVDVFTATAESLPYLAPEQVGIIRDIPVPDYRADVYALGVILYQLLAGRLPYEARNPQELAMIMEGAPPLPPNFANPHVSPLLSRFVMKAIAKEPPERHGSMEEFIRDLDAAKQPSREPERPRADFAQAPQYPPPSADSGLFGPPAPKESVDQIWPEAAQAKESTGERSAFSWFRTRAGRGRHSSGSRSENSSFTSPRSTRRGSSDFDEHTVVVSGRGGGRRTRRSLSDTFAGTSTGLDDMTGTGTLPRRRLSNKAYLIMAIAGAFGLGGIIVLYLLYGTSASGKITVNSIPSGAQVFINEDFIGATPTAVIERAPGVYRIRLQLEGYDSYVATEEIGENSDFRLSYTLTRQTPLVVAPPPLPSLDLPPPPADTPGPSPSRTQQFAGLFNNALRSRNLFPPASDNAWSVLQRWEQSEKSSPSPELEQARRSLCRETGTVLQEKLDHKDFPGAREILGQIRGRSAAGDCAAGLNATYDRMVSRSVETLRTSARAAMDRQQYVTPEDDNALKWLTFILKIDPEDSEARVLEPQVYKLAWDQAQGRAGIRQHQEALDIYMALKRHYANIPGGEAAVDQAIEKQRKKLDLAAELRKPFSVQVKHGHGRRYVIFGARECTGILRVDGFYVEYQGSEHQFKQPYDGLGAVKAERDKIIVQGNGVPDGKMELEQVEKNPNPSVALVAAKIQELRRLHSEYIRP